MISFDAIPNKETTDAPFDITATASSGLAVSFEIVSGPATISGNTITLDGSVGTVVVRATQSGNNDYNPAEDIERSFLVSEPVLLDQTISFDAIDDKFTRDAPVDISATASSGLPVSFEIISGPATISGNIITLDGDAGTVIVRASQSGNSEYNPALDVDQSFEVLKRDQMISFDAIPNKETTDAPFDITATASSGLSVSFEIVSGPATISDNTITLDGDEGTVVVRASQSGDNDYNAAEDVEQSFTVSEPVITTCEVVTNMALNKSTNQSSIVFGATSGKAVDGDTNGDFLSGSVIATGNELNPWWEVDLGENANIEEIRIWNRTDNRRDRLSNYYVLISDTPFSSNNLNTLLNDASVTNYYEADNAQEPTSISTDNLTGRYVRIQLNYREHLTIAEVEVMGCSSTIDDERPEVILSAMSADVTSAFPVNIDFTESIGGLAISDFVVSNATLSNLSGSNGSYTILATPIEEGLIEINLPANVVTDNSGNENLVSNTLQVTYTPNNNTTCASPSNLFFRKTNKSVGNCLWRQPQ